MSARRLLTVALAAVGLAAQLATVGCRREPPDRPFESPGSQAVVRYQDLVVDQALYGTFDPQTGVHTCADESRDSFVLTHGERRSFRIRLDRPGELLVGGCVDGAPVGSTAELGLAIESRQEGARRDRLGLLGAAPETAASGWRIHRLDLTALPPGDEIAVELQPAIPEGARLYVDTFAVRSERRSPPPPPARRAILISLDAFREDALGAIGQQTSTPELDRLLAESERFGPNWSAEISTKTSHASMLTGLPVELHGVDREELPLRPEIETLAERLAAAGVSTGAFMQTAPFFAEKFALNQGFESYRLKGWTTAQELRLAADWAAEHRDESSFLFVHLYGAHSDFGILPYEAEGVTRATVAERFGVAAYGCAGEVCASRRLLAINYRALSPLPREAEIARWLYARGVESLDRQLGLFFTELRRAGLWDETLVVLTGDHGEAFGEHGYFLHTTPHEEALRVPLVVKWPRSTARGGRVTERFTTALDIAPTVLNHFGLTAGDLPGHDLAEAPARSARLMLSKDAVRVDDLKLVRATPEFPRALYDLAADPGEQRNLLPGREADAGRLEEIRRLALAAMARRLEVRGSSKVEAQPFTDEERERLRSLGYL